ncbi:MAG: YgeY family selenium metabolism-linked hydrolase [Clostridium sp.]|nr:YgeY family selenium metabolism-linked hydrolase [Clostridium sp.]
MNDAIKLKIDAVMAELSHDLVTFARKIVRTKSMTCEEQEVAALIEAEMQKLGYDEVRIDETGNVIGRIGNGSKVLLFDSHMDTVTVIDEYQWDVDPYGGEIKDGKLYGRGAVDMKCPLAASVYGACIAKRVGLSKDVTIYVTASAMEEDFDGEAVRQFLTATGIRPDGVVICEPTDLKIATGHRGRALIEVTVTGKGCHASNPANGVNPVYLMEDIIHKVQEQAAILDAREGEKGSVALTNIYCSTASNNSVPQSATIILDRRLAVGETENVITEEMNQLVAGTEGTWRFSNIPSQSWTGKKFVFHSFLPAWKIAKDQALVLAAKKAYETMQGKKPVLFQMEASTNGVTTAGMFHLPKIVLGPGDIAVAHSVNEYCELQSMSDARRIYAALCLEEWT